MQNWRANLPLLMVITERFILIQVKTCLHRCRKRRSRRRKRSSFYSSLKAKKPLQRMAKRSNCMLTLATARILRWYCKMMPRELAYSAVSFYTWKKKIIRRKTNSLWYTRWLLRQWLGSRELSVH